MDALDVILALADYTACAQREDAAFDAYEGVTWGYDGADLIDARNDAQRRLEAALDSYIDDRIKKALASHEFQGQN